MQGDLAASPLDPGSVHGVLAWFSLIHTPPASLDAVVAELAPHGFVVERWDTRQDPGAKRPQGDLVARLTP